MAATPPSEEAAAAAHVAATSTSTTDRPVELSDMTTTNENSAPAETPAQQTTSPHFQQPDEPSTSTPPPEISQSDARKISEGLGPATDLPIAALTPSPAAGPTLSITLMLTTGARHPYKIDERYLRNRKVEAVTAQGSFDPREISGYKLKELIWTDWRLEWEPRPASPSSIRLIILGRLLEDKSALRDFPFKLDDANVVHMTVKPADFLDDDDAGGKTGKGQSLRGHDGEERGAGCRCVIL